MRLSAGKYVINNKRVVGVLVTALALSFMAMYVIYVLLQTTTESFKPGMLKMPARLSFASLTPKAYGLNGDDYETTDEYQAAYDQKQDELIKALKETAGIDDAYNTQILLSRYQSVIGEYSFETPLMEAEKVPGFLKHMNAELINGSLPEGDGEVLVDSVIMKNAGYEIGGYFMESYYGKNFKICGVIKSEYLVSVGTPMGYTNSGWYIVVYNDENTTDLRGLLEKKGIVLSEADKIWDAAAYEKEFHKEVDDVMTSVVSVIDLVVMIFLTILVLVAYISFMRNRVSEYCLYASIGYSRSEIYSLILREMFLLFLAGSLIGIIIALGASAVITGTLITPRGLIGRVVYTGRLLKILSTYIFVIGLLQIPVLVCVSRIKTIDMMEE